MTVQGLPLGYRPANEQQTAENERPGFGFLRRLDSGLNPVWTRNLLMTADWCWMQLSRVLTTAVR